MFFWNFEIDALFSLQNNKLFLIFVSCIISFDLILIKFQLEPVLSLYFLKVSFDRSV